VYGPFVPIAWADADDGDRDLYRNKAKTFIAHLQAHRRDMVKNSGINGEIMKIELPQDHPIAKAIQDATGPNWSGGHLFLSLDHLTPDGTAIRLLSYDIDTWSKITKHTEHFEFSGTDPAERAQALAKWPEPPDTLT
jgi:hypothetical protein